MLLKRGMGNRELGVENGECHKYWLLSHPRYNQLLNLRISIKLFSLIAEPQIVKCRNKLV